MGNEPLTLPLPAWLRDRFDLPRVLAGEGWDCRLRERFAMRSHEQAFVKTVLARRTNVWLFRSNQRRSCGDFVAIDMSSPRPAERRARVMELKAGEPLVRGGARFQCARYRDALDELVVRGVIDPASPVELLYGDEAAVLADLGV
ncbi:MAG TPA: hypothetical protein VIU61_23470 [Kofleriaceae bacterium]